MTLTILLIILTVFAVLGLTEFIHSFAYSLIYIENINTAMVVVLKEETALEQLKATNFEHKWFGNVYGRKIIAVYDKISEKELNSCKEYVLDKDIILVPIENFKNVIDAVF